MRASLLVVVVFALVSGGCSPDEPDEPDEPDGVAIVEGASVRPPQIQVEEDCRRLVELEASLQEMRQRYTEQHPDVRAARSEIAQLRTGLPADGTLCSEQLEQRPRAAEQLPPQ